MSIEISDRRYWRQLNYDDGILYISLLVIEDFDDWRLPEDFMELRKGVIEDFDDIVMCGMWFRGDGSRYEWAPVIRRHEYWVIPVRDII